MKLELKILIENESASAIRETLKDAFVRLDYAYANAGSERELTKLEADALADGGKYYDSDGGSGWTSELILDTQK